MVDFDVGVVLEVDIIDGGCSFEVGYFMYWFSELVCCKLFVQFLENSCCVSIGICLDDICMVDCDVLCLWCVEGVLVVCKVLLFSYEIEVCEVVMCEDIGEEDLDLQELVLCKFDSGQYDVEVCKEVVSMVMVKVFVSILLSSQKLVLLLVVVLDDVIVLCCVYLVGMFCQDVVQVLWIVGCWLLVCDVL